MALETISAEDVNVTCIHSVPLGKMGEYAFYCEFEGHRLDMGMLMNNLHAHTESFDVLGSFPQSPLPE
jgi:prephenate dehydratase